MAIRGSSLAGASLVPVGGPAGLPGQNGKDGAPGKDGVTQDISGKLDKTGNGSELTVTLLGGIAAPALPLVLGLTAYAELFRQPSDRTDWGPAIQQAQAYLAGTGGAIRIATPGVLLIKTPVTFPKGNPYLKLVCDSQATIIQNDPSLTSAMFLIGGAAAAGGAKVDIEGGTYAGANTANSYAFALTNANGMTFRRVAFKSLTTAINSNAGYALTLDDVSFDGVTTPFYSSTSAHNFVARRVKVYGGGTVYRFDGPTDNASIIEGDYESTGVIVQIAGGTALRLVGNYIEYMTSQVIFPTAPIYGADISNNWLALGSGSGATWTLSNFIGGQLKGNSVYNQIINFGSGTVDIEVGDNIQTGTGSIAPMPFQAPTLSNSWTQQANYTPIGFRKARDGRVYLRGNLVNATSALGTSAFTLPAGYRPSTIRTLLASNSSNGVTAIQIGTDGTVKIMQTSGAGTSGNPYQASLDGVAFDPGV